MRIRSIKPEFWSDKRVASWDLFTRLFFIGLWSAADDYGRGSAEPQRLAAELFPYDLSRDSRETLAKVSGALARLSEESRITLYTVNDETFFEVCNWTRHQRVDKPGKSRVPTTNEGVIIHSRDSRETVATPSRLEQGAGSVERGAGSVEQVDAPAALPPSPAGWVAAPMPELALTCDPAPKPKPAPKPPADDKAWIAALEADRDAYGAIDVRGEVARCIRWCETKGKKPSRARILNWLNRAAADKGVNASAAQMSEEERRSGLF